MNPELLEALRQLGLGAGPDLPTDTAVTEPSGAAAPIAAGGPAESEYQFTSIDDDPRYKEALARQVQHANEFDPNKYAIQGQRELVNAYLKKSSEPLRPDPGMDAAVDESKKLRLANHLFGSSAPGPGLTTALGLAGVAPPQRVGGRDIDSEAPVRDYIAKRGQALKQREMELSGLGKTGTLGLQAARLQLNADTEGRVAGSQATSQLGKRGAQKNKEETSAVRIEQGETRLGQGERKTRATETGTALKVGQDTQHRLGNTISGVSGDFSNSPSKPVQQLAKMASTYSQAKGIVDEMKKQKDPTLGYAKFWGTKGEATVNELRAMLSPIASTGAGFQTFTKEHQELANFITGQPNANIIQKLKDLNPAYVEAQLDGLLEEVRRNVDAQARSTPGAINGSFNPGKPAKQSATVFDRASGEYASKPITGGDTGLKKVKMLSPNGKVKLVDAKDVAAAKASGGTIVEEDHE